MGAHPLLSWWQSSVDSACARPASLTLHVAWQALELLAWTSRAVPLFSRARHMVCSWRITGVLSVHSSICAHGFCVVVKRWICVVCGLCVQSCCSHGSQYKE